MNEDNKIRAIIVDDEANARMALKGILSENFQEVEVLAEASNVPEAIKIINQHKPDVVFLDIEMPGYSGLDILDFFSPEQITFQIIFVTAYNQYAINAFELSATDYILKPIQKKDLERAINKLKNERNKLENLNVLKANLNEKEKNKKIALNTNSGQIFVDIDDIILVKAEGSYSNIILKGKERIMISKKLIEFEKLTSIGRFIRVHRSYIINLNLIKLISRKSGYNIKMIDGSEVPVSKEKQKELNESIIEPKF